jgi:hypothetical protein
MRLLLALLLVSLAAPALAEVSLPNVVSSQPPVIHGVQLILPTDRYDHAVLGDALEWGGLHLSISDCPLCGRVPEPFDATITLPETRVFEDIEARLSDVTGDGLPEVIVVETDLNLGASLAVYGPEGKIAATPFIGQPNRWLAPAGIADFDGDGRVEIAYVDRPHLLGELVFVRLEGKRLREVARLGGLSNHRIGEDTITGGVRTCGKAVELVLASKDFDRLMLVSYEQGQPEATDLGPFSQGAVDAALDCRQMP